MTGASAGPGFTLRPRGSAEAPQPAPPSRRQARRTPQIFAESEVAGDGRDWNQAELALLGDLSVAMPVQVFDDGRHAGPEVHREPFAALLIFTPGALLRNGQGLPPVDLAEVTRDGNRPGP